MKVKRNAKGVITGIRHSKSTAETAMRYCARIMMPARTVDRGAGDVEENET
jgi:hypothetical protein